VYEFKKLAKWKKLNPDTDFIYRILANVLPLFCNAILFIFIKAALV